MSKLTTKQQIVELFSNFTWYDAQQGRLGSDQVSIVSHWTNDGSTDVFVTLGMYMISTVSHSILNQVFPQLTIFSAKFFLAIFASTIPVPNGSMFPIFRIGAAFGRLVGEMMHRWVLAEGMIGSSLVAPVLPGTCATNFLQTKLIL